MSKLETLNVNCVKADGSPAFVNPRFLRVSTKSPTSFCVARHKQAIIVNGIVNANTVRVDLTAPRINLDDTRAAKYADIGLTPKEPTKSVPATSADLPALIAKYKANVLKRGPSFITNALKHTKDPLKVQAMQVALGLPQSPAVAKPSRKKGKASASFVASPVEAASPTPAQFAERMKDPEFLAEVQALLKS